MTHKVLRDFLGLATREKAEVVKVDDGKHYKVHLRAPDGRVGVFIEAKSPSDHRGQHNARSRIRRFIAGQPIT